MSAPADAAAVLPRIDGHTGLIAHIGWPTHSFKAPLIWNPWLAASGAQAVVVPFGCRPPAFADLLRSLFALENIRGALITMPHKVRVVELLGRLSPVAAAAGSCNAVRRAADGVLEGDMFDGEGFVRGLRTRGVDPAGQQALVVGCGGVGSAIAASLAAAGVRSLRLHDVDASAQGALAARLARHFPQVALEAGDDPAGCGIAVNATPLGMAAGDPLPFDPDRLSPGCLVGEVVLSQAITPLLAAAQARGCAVQVGTDMLFEMIPAYLAWFGLPVATPAQLRALARL